MTRYQRSRWKRFAPLRAAAAALAVTTAVPAQADWQQDFGTLRIGMVSPSGGRAIPGVSRMKAAFAEAAGVPAEIFAAKDYEALIRAMASGRIHYAVFSATAYAAADAYCQCVEPLAAPRAVDGAVGLRAVIVARRDKALTLPELSDARIVAGPNRTPGPQSLALAALEKAGLPGSAVSHAISLNAAEKAFVAGEAHAVVGWIPAYMHDGVKPKSGTLARLEQSSVDLDSVSVVWSSGVLAFGPHAARRDMPKELKERLGSFLATLYDSHPEIYALVEPYRGGGFAQIEPAAYEAAGVIVSKLVSR
ncbi:MAG: PhnD/SsuA/transferrin family substrate-binding protein [Rhizobiaceae bacterium]|jgi:phosphonate transport system substrate-binding protein|nr:PhnD/SsuA/transferrin family substrate-binding protein [Rhizobiaceae bacterium]